MSKNPAMLLRVGGDAVVRCLASMPTLIRACPHECRHAFYHSLHWLAQWTSINWCVSIPSSRHSAATWQTPKVNGDPPEPLLTHTYIQTHRQKDMLKTIPAFATATGNERMKAQINWHNQFINIASLISRVWCNQLIAWHSGRTSVFDRQTFSVLCSTCSWWVTTYVGKPSAVGQPTRPTQLFILSG